METIRQARQRLTAAGINFQSDQGGGYDLYRGSVHVGRVYSDAGLRTWQPPAEHELAPDEQRALEQHEAVIARGLQTFLEVGEALASIRDDKLYRAGYATFDAYCRERWNIGRSRAYQLMGAAEIVREMSTQVDNPPTTEREARAVAQAEPADRPRVLDRADQLAGDAPRTAKHVQQAVAEIAAPALPDVARFGFTARLLADGWIGLCSPGDLESRHTAAHLAQLIAAWDAYPPIPADLAAVGVVWRYRTERNYYQTMIGTGIGPTGYTPEDLFETTRDRMRRLGGLPAESVPAVVEPPADDGVPHLPPDFAQAHARAKKIDLLLSMNGLGEFALRDERGAGVGGYGWASILVHLEDMERAARQPQAPTQTEEEQIVALCGATGAKYLGPDEGRFMVGWPAGGGGSYPAEEALRRLRALPTATTTFTRPRRPRRPQSADSSAVLTYLDQIEAYATMLEDYIKDFERMRAA